MAAVEVARAQDPGRTPTNRLFPTGSVIFFHPDGTGLNHWNVARLYFKGVDGLLNWDLLPNMANYRGHMFNTPIGTSNGGATTHAFGYKFDGLGSFGKDGDGAATPATDKFIYNLANYSGSIMRQAANAGLPVGVVNDGHIGEPGTGCFLAEVGNRGNWQEITRQMIQGRPGFSDVAPWVIMGGGEADTRPQGATLLHRNHNGERGNSQTGQSLRTDAIDLEADWNDNGSANLSNDPAQLDDWIVVKTRAQFQALRTALNANPNYAPRVLGIFAYQDQFNDRTEESLIARSSVNANPANFVGPVVDPAAPNRTPGFRSKASRLVLWGDPVSGNAGFNPPTFAEMTEVAIQILDRAARQQSNPNSRRFFLVAEQEANDNFGNNDNAIGLLHAMNDTDVAIGVARNYVAANPRTLILTAADSDAGGMQVTAPYRSVVTNTAGLINASANQFGVFGTSTAFQINPTSGTGSVINVAPDGLEGRGTDATSGGTTMFLSEPDQFGQRHEFAIGWSGTADYTGGMISRAAGLNAGLLNSLFSARFDNIDVYRMMHLTLFGNLPPYPTTQAPVRP